MQPALRICLSGALSVELAGKPVECELSGRQGREVFAYLVLNRGRPVCRDELAALLWPDRPPRSPEAALNTILARLRRIVGRSVLAGRAQLTLELGPQTWIDIQAAEEAACRAERLLAQAGTTDALQLASSAFDFVAGTLLPDVQHAWVHQWRSEVDDIRTRLLTIVARCGLMLGGGRLVDADRAARRLIEREPFRESGYALLMEVHAARGDVAEALLVYERLRGLLRDELGIPPSARVASLHERLLTDGAKVRSASGGMLDKRHHRDEKMPLPPVLARNADRQLVGRKAELDALLDHWRAVRSGSHGVVALAGEPGIGKTMLASWLAHEAHREGALASIIGEGFVHRSR